MINKNSIVQALLPSLSAISFQSHAEAFAPTNIALCKYWGKRNTELNLPITSSLSLSLPAKGAWTSLILSDHPHDTVRLNQQLLLAESTFVQRLVAFLDLFRQPKQWYVHVDITMNIPVAAGLASSACGFAALTKALNVLFQWQLPERDLSILARLGSGSASRSLWNGFVEWHAGVREDGMDSYSEPLAETWPALCIGILPVSNATKPIASRPAMEQTVATSPLYSAWPKKVADDLAEIKQAISTKDFSRLGRTAESNAMTMHATMLSSWPPICYYLPETIAYMQKIWDLRQQGMNIYFTQDAGPNLKILFLQENQIEVRNYFPKLEI